ncbi:MAG: hypothetical protein ACFFCI_06475 [Promethearchaeota archaeon]
MERNFKTILIVVNLIFVFSIISIPTIVIFAEFAGYNKINKSFTYEYISDTPPLQSGLNVYSDVGIIDIKYVTEPVEYIIKIELSIEMAGPNLNGKSYIDFFNISWENVSSPVNFTLDLISDRILDFSNLHIAAININILLRADILFDINVTVLNGNIKVTVPMGISVNNLYSNVNNGNILYDFNNNIVEGNITGIMNNGNLTLEAKNIHYTQNSELFFVNNRGYSLIDIHQYDEMGANITGTAKTKSGTIQVVYMDFSASIGAQFILYNKTNFGNEVENKVEGFTKDYLPFLAGQIFTSDDFPAQNYYNFSLFKLDEGDYIWDLYSIPN